MSRALHLFYQNLRLQDQPSIIEACHSDEMLCLYVLDTDHRRGGASKWWLHQALASLSIDLKEHGQELTLALGPLCEVVLDYVKTYHITDVYIDCPVYVDVKALQKGLNLLDVKFHKFCHSLLFDPFNIFTKNGDPYQVFTPFYHACLKQTPPQAPVGRPRVWPKTIKAKTLKLASLNLLSSYWDLKTECEPTEKGGHALLKRFKTHKMKEYSKARDFPADQGTSGLSAYLHFGQLSPHQVYHEAFEPSYRRQLIWREFTHYLLVHFPYTMHAPLKREYEHFPWTKNAACLKKWEKGNTGVPIVDAGMRQLWQTGWMHNRVRMIVGSFLVKDLLIPWQDGLKWFTDTLVDADLANNIFGWQWVAGCGADAAPYFRVFNPYIQSAKFDPQGTYIKTYVPELKGLDESMIHNPSACDATSLEQRGVILGENYPWPLVDHEEARKKALKLYHEWKT